MMSGAHSPDSLSPRRGNQPCRSRQLRRMHVLSMRKMILPLLGERAGVRGNGALSNPNALDSSIASIPLTPTLSPRRGRVGCRRGGRTPRTSRAQGDSEPTPTPPRRGTDKARCPAIADCACNAATPTAPGGEPATGADNEAPLLGGRAPFMARRLAKCHRVPKG